MMEDKYHHGLLLERGFKRAMKCYHMESSILALVELTISFFLENCLFLPQLVFWQLLTLFTPPASSTSTTTFFLSSTAQLQLRIKMGHVIKKSDYENAVVLNVSRKRSPSPRGRPVTDEMGELINASKGLQLKVQQLEANLEQQGFELERVKAERDKLARAVDLIISGSNQAFEKFKSSVPNWCKVDNNGNLVLILAGATGDDTGEGAEDQIYGVFRGVQAPKESKSNNGVQESTVQSSSGVQESTVQSSSGVQESTVQESTVQESTVQSSSGVQESTVQSNSGVQESTVQESTVQSSSGVQESTVQSNSGR
ncbi:hypothetical protein ACQ4LE_003211 [Meloidogyne hapla]